MAIKCISKATVLETDSRTQIANETGLLKKLSHRFIVSMHHVCQDEQCVYLLIDYVSGGTLEQHLKLRGSLSEPDARFYTCNIAAVLRHMHRKCVVYRDLKPDNLMIGADGYLKLIDFGFAKCLRRKEQTYTLCGTADYIAPEVVANTGHSLPVDYWSLGVVLFQMLSAQLPYSNVNEEIDMYTVYNNIIGKSLKFPDRATGWSNGAKQLIEGLLQRRPKQRLSHDGLQSHAWFSDITWSDIYDQKIESPFRPGPVRLAGCKASFEDLSIRMKTQVSACTQPWNLQIDQELSSSAMKKSPWDSPMPAVRSPLSPKGQRLPGSFTQRLAAPAAD